MSRALRVLLAVVLAVAGLVAIATFLQSRDDAGLDDAAAPGEEAPGQDAATLRRGNVILGFADPADRAPLRAVAEEIAGPPEPELEEAGQAVLLERRADGPGVEALAFRRRLSATGPDDPELRTFIEYWLGRGQEGGT